MTILLAGLAIMQQIWHDPTWEIIFDWVCVGVLLWATVVRYKKGTQSN